MLKEERVYVSKDEKLREKIIQLHYNMPIAGYWWPEMTKEVKQYVKECNQCQRIKNSGRW